MSEHTKDINRCAICGWPLSDSVDNGCVRGNCSMRPFPDRYYDAARAKQEYAPHQIPDESPPTECEIMATTIATLKVQRDELLVALKTYGAHLPNCAYAVNHPLIDKCTCGYEAAIANAEKDKE